MKIYSLNKNIVRVDKNAKKQWVQSKLLRYYSTIEGVNKAIKTHLFQHILKEKMVGEDLKNAKNNQILLKERVSELNYAKYPIFFFEEIDVIE